MVEQEEQEEEECLLLPPEKIMKYRLRSSQMSQFEQNQLETFQNQQFKFGYFSVGLNLPRRSSYMCASAPKQYYKVVICIYVLFVMSQLNNYDILLKDILHGKYCK